VRILVTNDDGVDAVGLHVLARRLTALGDVVIAAPDREYSGAGAALGTLHLIRPEVRRVEVQGVPDAWSVTGPPALCVMFARLGVFGGAFDLVVSGINPGANSGRAIYHSGTVGAALTARNGGVSGLAVSQAVNDFGVEGQGWDEMLTNQRWDTAAEIGAQVAKAMLQDLPADPVVLNVNVPNRSIDALAGWRRTEVALLPPRTLASA
jgi:5'-nucleotidase